MRTPEEQEQFLTIDLRRRGWEFPTPFRGTARAHGGSCRHRNRHRRAQIPRTKHHEGSGVGAPTLAFVSLQQHLWLAEERAVLLEIEVEHVGDSLHNRRSMFFLYDFARGDLRTCCLEPVWTFQSQRASGGTASCDELRAFAAKLK